jgi:hypothetical protein
MEGNTAWDVSQPTATECALYLCADMYEAKTRDGELTESVPRSWANRDAESYKPDPKPSIYNYTDDQPILEL